MLRTALKLVFLAVLVVAGAVGIYTYEKRTSVQVQLDQERRKTQELSEVVAHLQASDRVADVIVTEQREVDGVLQTTLLFVEYGKDGSALPAKRFTFEGKQAHIVARINSGDTNTPLRSNDSCRECIGECKRTNKRSERKCKTLSYRRTHEFSSIIQQDL